MSVALFLPILGGLLASADIFAPINTDLPRTRLELLTEIANETTCRELCTKNSSCLAIVYSSVKQRCALMGETIADKCTANYTAVLRIPEDLTTNLTWYYNVGNAGSMYCGDDECIAYANGKGYGKPNFNSPTLIGTILKAGEDVMDQMRKICPEHSDSRVLLDHHFDNVTMSDIPFLNATAKTNATTGMVSSAQGACGATVSINQYRWLRSNTKELRRMLSKTTPPSTALDVLSVYWFWP